MVYEGRVDYSDVDAWASQRELKNEWGDNPDKFPTSDFTYRSENYSVHRHGENPAAIARFSGSNAAKGPTLSVTDRSSRPNLMEGQNLSLIQMEHTFPLLTLLIDASGKMDFLSLYRRAMQLPTVMNYEDEKKLIEKFMCIDIDDMLLERDKLFCFFEKIYLSHIDNGYMEVEDEDKKLFRNFSSKISSLIKRGVNIHQNFADDFYEE